MNIRFFPENLDQYKFFNVDISNKLMNYNKNNLTNFIFYGPKNAGKKTLVFNLLNYIYNTNVLKQTNINNIEIKIGNNTVNIEYKSSPYHFEINLYEYGFYDKNVISDFIHKLLSYDNINVGIFKVIILYQFDKLTENAQLCLKRIIETTSKVGRFICISSNISSLDSALLSRFTLIRVPYPKEALIRKYIKYHLDSNNISYNTSDLNKLMLKKHSIYLLNLELEYVINNKCIKSLMEKDEETVYIKELIRLIEIKDICSILQIRDICYKALLVNINSKKLLTLIFKHYFKRGNLCQDMKKELVSISGIASSKIANIEYDIIVFEYYVLNLKKLLIKYNMI